LVVLSLLFLGETAAARIDVGRISALDETLAAVRDCMVRCPPPWPKAWQAEYLDTIRQAASLDPNILQYARRLRIVEEGFTLYWPDLKNTQERSQFEVRRAQIRWYVENFMAAELPGEEETALLRHQYEGLANHAAQGLIAQFSFLDPNKVQAAKAAYLADCYQRIDAPLLPIFMTPFSQSQIERIKERWHDLRYARVDLWRQLGSSGTSSSGNQTVPSGQAHPDCVLAQRSLDLWQAHVWALAATQPEFYSAAVARDLKAREQGLNAIARSHARVSRMDTAMLQTECWCFLVTALLETAHDESLKSPSETDAGDQGR
jgi:hypothetical protein